MNKHVKSYLQRGIAFGGFGPIIMGIIFLIIEGCGEVVLLSGTEVLIAILSTYILAFVQAGSSVFNQMETWPIAKSLGLHFLSLYIVYVGCYLVNRWLPFVWELVAAFTVIFALVYFAIWAIVYFIVRKTSKNLNKNILK